MRVHVAGTVQGVGFRPFVYRRAVALGLTGTVRNDRHGVVIDLQGEARGVADLVAALRRDAPPLARVSDVRVEPIGAAVTFSDFRIVDSDARAGADAPVSVDTATCADCLAEVDNPANRRYRYPFTNCTNCGPRYTIVQGVPYDRANTTMVAFQMCAACQAEYDDPSDRRFHAQPNACPACGPRLAWLDPVGDMLASADRALSEAIRVLGAGGVVAVKGIGGYHLTCDATASPAVLELRRRKSRDDKPFAVMVATLDEAGQLCDLTPAATAALTSSCRPIVLAPRRGAIPIATAVAPGLRDLGLMLPYTPLHHLLLQGVNRPLVMTSGNLADEPIAHEEPDAVARLGPLADGILAHDRPIEIRCDDSVARATSSGLQLLRRSRGHAPEPLDLPIAADTAILAVGGQLKNTVAVARGSRVVASHHIGDLEHLATYRSFLQAVEHLPVLAGIKPDIVAHDLHPEYLSTKFAAEADLPALPVQHHHAHVAACMVDHGRREAVLGLAFDGAGYGEDGSLWGGEFLVADLRGFQRVAHLATRPLPGGAAAIRQPWRMAAVWSSAAGRDTRVDSVDETSWRAVLDLASRTDCLATSSVGRLFDAVAVLLGARPRVTYEAQAAIELEALAAGVDPRATPDYGGVVVEEPAPGQPLTFDPTTLVAAVVDQRAAGVPPAIVAAGFHRTLGEAVAALAIRLAADHGLDAVALTGGVFQNVLFGETVASSLCGAGLKVLTHCRVPPNDGGISIGQAAVAAARTSDR